MRRYLGTIMVYHDSSRRPGDRRHGDDEGAYHHAEGVGELFEPRGESYADSAISDPSVLSCDTVHVSRPQLNLETGSDRTESLKAWPELVQCSISATYTSPSTRLTVQRSHRLSQVIEQLSMFSSGNPGKSMS